jgi:hypothetical protein
MSKYINSKNKCSNVEVNKTIIIINGNYIQEPIASNKSIASNKLARRIYKMICTLDLMVLNGLILHFVISP